MVDTLAPDLDPEDRDHIVRTLAAPAVGYPAAERRLDALLRLLAHAVPDPAAEAVSRLDLCPHLLPHLLDRETGPGGEGEGG